MKALLESGVHFGHRTNKWNPKMRSYIFTERNGIHIIDLQQTVDLLDEAYDFIRDKVANGGTVLFVGTKRQAQDTIREQAERCGMPYVNERWLGGTITNWFTIQKRIFELERLERMRDSGEIDLLTKKEGLMIEREIERLTKRLSGIRIMKRLPDILFVVDVNREDTAVHEANLKEIPVVAMVDTNCDPGNIDYIIPSNDDAIRAIKLVVGKVADAVMEGRAIRGKEAEEEEMVAEPMPAEVSRFIDDEEELEDEELLGESTLKHIGSSKPAKRRKQDLDEEDEEDEIIDKELEEVVEEEPEEEPQEETEEAEEKEESEASEETEETEEEPEVEEEDEEEPEEDVEDEDEDEEDDEKED
jgi:small subunit ribosomal protein S2